MVCPAPAYTGIRDDNVAWSNWSERARKTIRAYFTPTLAGSAAPRGPLPPPSGLQQLVRVVKDATDQRKSLHAIGSGWAFDDQAVGDDWVIDIQELRSRLLSTTGEALTAGFQAGLVSTGPGLTNAWRAMQADRTSTRKLVHVEAGIKLWQLIQILDGIGLALPTLGGANGQALAGVINTSVHGGDWNQPAFPGLVRALHLVTEGGREIWIEPASAPITQDDRLKPTLSCPDVEIIRNDEVFNAAVVGLGRFGVVYSYVIEVRPQFWVAEVVTQPDRNAVFAALRQGASNAASPFGALLSLLDLDPGPASVMESRTGVPPSFFQLLLHTRNPPGIWVQRQWITADRTESPPAINDPPGALTTLLMLSLLAANPVGSLFNAQNPVFDAAVTLAFTNKLNESMTQGRRGKHAWITAGPPSGVFSDFRGVSVEVMFDANNPAYVDFLEAMLAAGGRFRQVGWLTLRPTLATKASLSMHNVRGTHAVSIEIALLAGLPDNESFLTFIQQDAVARGGRLHWGQANNVLTPQIVAAQYGGLLDSWRRGLSRVSGDSGTFSNNFTRRRGLEPVRNELVFRQLGNGRIKGNPVAVSWGSNRIDLFAQGTDDAVWTKSWDGSQWSGYAQLGSGKIKGRPVVVSRGQNRLDLFVWGTDDAVWTKSWDGSSWSDYTRLGAGKVKGPPVALARGSDRIDLFVLGTDDRLWTKSLQSTQWTDYERLGDGKIKGPPVAIASDAVRVDLFVQGTDDRLWTKFWDGATWSDYIRLGDNQIKGPPSAVSWGAHRIDLFVRGTDDAVWTKSWDGDQWSDYVQLGANKVRGLPVAVCWGPNRVDVFVQGTDEAAWTKSWDGVRWSDFSRLGQGKIRAAPAAVSRGPNRIDLFVQGMDDAVWTMSWDGAKWA